MIDPRTQGLDLTDFVDFGDVARDRLHMQCQYASRYVDGICDYPNLTSDPKLGRELRVIGRIGNYHDYLIHKDDVEEFIRRVKVERQMI